MDPSLMTHPRATPETPARRRREVEAGVEEVIIPAEGALGTARGRARPRHFGVPNHREYVGQA